MGLIERVESGPIALDTACFIYFIEEHAEYLPAVEPVFAAIGDGRLPELDHGQLRAAAQLRAVHPRLRTPDALQIAAALTSRCVALITNDRKLPDIPGLEVLQVKALVEASAIR